MKNNFETDKKTDEALQMAAESLQDGSMADSDTEEAAHVFPEDFQKRIMKSYLGKMRRKRRITWGISLASAVAILVICIGLRQDYFISPEEQYAFSEKEAVFLRETVAGSTYIFTGTCTSSKVDPETLNTHWSVDVDQVFRGESLGSTAQLRMAEAFTPKVGKEYLIFAEKFQSVFEDCEYLAPIETVFTSGDGLYCDSIQDIAGLSYEKLLRKLPKIVDQTPCTAPPVAAGAYLKTKDPIEAAEGSDYILQVSQIEIEENVAHRSICYCRVDKVIKGQVEGSTIEVIVPQGSVKDGGSYLLLLTKPDEMSISYAVSSTVSVLTPEDSVAVRIIDMMLK